MCVCVCVWEKGIMCVCGGGGSMCVWEKGIMCVGGGGYHVCEVCVLECSVPCSAWLGSSFLCISLANLCSLTVLLLRA